MPRVRRISLALAVWGLVYAAYRGYYALGGTAGMVGTPASDADWRALNAAGVAILLPLGLLPLALLPLWRRPRMRPALLALSWLLAVGGVMHALVMDVQRVASLAGVHRVRYPASEWASIDRRRADLQDMLFNETWFLVEGLLWGLLALAVIGRSRGGRRWTATAAAGVAALTCLGLLSAFGVVGRAIVA
jgi:hypothetical protein